ncbi:endonuclease/exonuclease/phosphatase family protein [Kineobactrum sediminis]|uniref:Endonuclease/exonuclease/phosphatase family protein n=1 Tax=Kineobactrum sediminis TaxID=1905677 RepID=A0A2N5Y602_9GAMM|nr:endonuclease/exonuclease/phosphatase family protein [Kineobactrum sediminis]PLW83823.1 endonuclease/exonuclease/phosphatase family protein [Kineobactrum sediminis]
MRNTVNRLLFILVLSTSNTVWSNTEMSLRVATFNVSMTGDNYTAPGEAVTGNELFEQLATGTHQQIRTIAETIQRVRPDILLLNEFDFSADPARGVDAFRRRFLLQSRQGADAIDYPYYYLAPVNAGIDSGFDLDGDGIASGRGQDALGYGLYPGQYGMLLLSRYPIEHGAARTFQQLLWRDMPGNLLVDIRDSEGSPWYTEAMQQVLRLSSKSHWDIPVRVNGQLLRILASHPTPPVFDGPENRNGKRNHDEIRFWVDYLDGGVSANYIRDDAGGAGGLRGNRFIILGDLNASPVEGDAWPAAIDSLLNHPQVNATVVPTSAGGRENQPDNPHAASHTADFKLRVDYVLPSVTGLRATAAGVFWPAAGDPLARLAKDRHSSSDHRLVWMDLVLEKIPVTARDTGDTGDSPEDMSPGQTGY